MITFPLVALPPDLPLIALLPLIARLLKFLTPHRRPNILLLGKQKTKIKSHK
jgi:hypothetical protein